MFVSQASVLRQGNPSVIQDKACYLQVHLVQLVLYDAVHVLTPVVEGEGDVAATRDHRHHTTVQ